MTRPAWVSVDLDAVLHNYTVAKSMAPAQQAMAVVKANAYGHGAIAVAQKLEGQADAFAVACLEEAIELRQASIVKPILLLEGFFSADELDDIVAHDLWITVHSLAQIKPLAGLSLQKPLTVFLKMDSGMHRLGISPANYTQAYKQLQALDSVGPIVLMSHFSSADDASALTTEAQMSLFKSATQGLTAPVSLANSAAIFAHPQSRQQWQRPGIMLYGASPFNYPHKLADQTLRPAMTLFSEVIAVRELAAGEKVGYGGTWVCAQPTRMGTVALGYGDGYPRQAKNGTPVMVNGQRTALIGRVSMDLITVDLSGIDAGVGSRVEFWGKSLSANEVAACCDTIAYTLFTGLTQRVHRHLLNTS